MAQLRRWHVYPNVENLHAHAAQAIERAAAQAVAARGRFAIVLAGGTTPMNIYVRLARASAEWPRWHVYFGDERCLPAGAPGRNDAAIRAAWLERVPIPPAQVHAIPAERGAAEAAQEYGPILAAVDQFDLVLLGLGEDGHTASLFPGLALDGADVLAVYDAPKPPPERVSLGASRLSRARQLMFVVSGAAKRRAVAAWRRGDPIPAAAVVPPAGVDILLGASAWPEPPG